MTEKFQMPPYPEPNMYGLEPDTVEYDEWWDLLYDHEPDVCMPPGGRIVSQRFRKYTWWERFYWLLRGKWQHGEWLQETVYDDCADER